MLNELLEMLGGDEGGERECCQRRRPRADGVRGLLARLFGDDDHDGNDRGADGRCCSDVNRDRDALDPDRDGRRRDRDDRDDGFDFGD